jgi:putative membrane protein
MMHEYGNFMGFGWLIPIVVIVAIYLGFKRYEKTPLDILNERYAKGEIDETEYLQKRKLL